MVSFHRSVIHTAACLNSHLLLTLFTEPFIEMSYLIPPAFAPDAYRWL